MPHLLRIKSLQSNQGFSLLEILIAMVLVTFVLGYSINFTINSRASLDEAINDVERAVRFGSDEAALRSAMVRLHFMLTEKPHQLALEYGPGDGFVIPAKMVEEADAVESREEEESGEKLEKKINQQFNKIKEFREKNIEFPDVVSVVGVGTTLVPKLISKGGPAVYLYPSGERDGAIIILGTDEELATIEIAPYSGVIEVNYHPLDPSLSLSEVEDARSEKAKELYEEWLKKN